jgi:autotransporter-associated beta strand protein
MTMLLRVLIAACLAAPASHAEDLIWWDIPVSNSAVASTSAPNGISGISGTPISRGPGLTAGDNASTGWRAKSFNQTGSTEANFEAALADGDYFTFSVTAGPTQTVTINGLRALYVFASGTGPDAFRIVYSMDGTTWNKVGNDMTGVLTAAVSAQTATSSWLAANPVILTPNQTVTFRIIGVAAASTGGNGGLRGNGADGDATKDLVLLGSIEQPPTADLIWNGGEAGSWGTGSSGFKLADNTPKTFSTGDNVIINNNATETITIVGGGVIVGDLVHTNTAGATTIGGDSITGSTLTKSGSGSLRLASANVIGGATTLSGGILQLGSSSSLGTSAIAASNGATLSLDPDVAFANSISVGAGGLLLNAEGVAGISGSVTGSSGINVTKTGAGNLTLGGQFGAQTSAPMDLDVLAGTVTLTGGQKNLVGTNTFDGDVHLNGSILHLHASIVEGTGSIIFDSATSKIVSRLNAGAVTVNNPIMLNAGGTFESPNGNNTLTIAGPISGDFGLDKIGNGNVDLTAISTYTGLTTTAGTGQLRILEGASLPGAVQATNGTLRVDGTVGSVTTAAGTNFRGDGTVKGASTINGTHNPGNLTAGIQTFEDNLTYGPGAAIVWELLTNTATQGETTPVFDQVVVGGVLNFSGAATLRLSFDNAASLENPPVQWSDPFWNVSRSWLVFATSQPIDGLANLGIELINGLDGYGDTFSTARPESSFSLAAGADGLHLVYTAPSAGTAFEQWLAANFGANANDPAIAGDTADFDGDGIPTLLEYALLGNPLVADASILPVAEVVDGRLSISFFRDPARNDINIIVKGGDALGSLAELGRSQLGGAFVATAPGASVSETGSSPMVEVTFKDAVTITDPATSRRFLIIEVERPQP